MNQKLQFIAGVFLAALAAGCASDNRPVFTSDAMIPAEMADASAVARGLSKTDQRKIDLLVFSNLLERHFWGDGAYSAFFIQADDDVVAALIKKYPKHIPPVKPASHLDLSSNQSPLDRDTGLPALILSAEPGELHTNASVAVTSRWYAGATATGSCVFSLKKTGGDWAIASVK